MFPYLTLKLFAPDVETVTVDFDKIIPAVVSGEFDAGLIIHEGQLTYGQDGLTKILDLGVWWNEQTGLPLPLGGNAMGKALHKVFPDAVSKQHRIAGDRVPRQAWTGIPVDRGSAPIDEDALELVPANVVPIKPVEVEAPLGESGQVTDI